MLNLSRKLLICIFQIFSHEQHFELAFPRTVRRNSYFRNNITSAKLLKNRYFSNKAGEIIPPLFPATISNRRFINNVLERNLL